MEVGSLSFIQVLSPINLQSFFTSQVVWRSSEPSTELGNFRSCEKNQDGCHEGFQKPMACIPGIFSYIHHKNQPNVGKYTSPMDGMGNRVPFIKSAF